ncbi:MAG: hypothetical protein V4525_08215 [Pseudomonadota bacterium]
MKTVITPFSNEATTIEELNIESADDKISIFGNLELTRDKEGLKKAESLKTI